MKQIPFVQARHFTKGPRTSKIGVLVIHTMESPEKPDTAEAVANWFASEASPIASAHYCIDSNSIVQCVRDRDVAYHAPGCNHNGLGFEHAGRAAQHAKDWSDPYSTAMLLRSAELAAAKCVKYDIPAKWLGPAALLAGQRGITSHANVSKAFKRSDHHDPGPDFPIEQYIGWVRSFRRGVIPAL